MNNYKSTILEVNGYYVLFNNSKPFTFVKKCKIIEISDKIYIDKYEYDTIIDKWKFSWYAIWVMIAHCRRDMGK